MSATPPGQKKWQAHLAELGLDGGAPPDLATWRTLLARLESSEPVGESWYRQLVEASPNPIFVVDPDGCILSWNGACNHTFGYGDEALGLDYRRLLEPEADEPLTEVLQKVLAGATFANLSVSYRSVNDTPVHMVSRVYPLVGADGGVHGGVFANTDVTERRRMVAEREHQRAFYEHILNSVPIEIVVLDAEHRYVFCNPEAIKNDAVRRWVVGKDDFEYCAHRGFNVKIAADRRKHFQRALGREEAVSWEETFLTATGEVRYHARNYSPVYGPGGDLEMVLGYGQDVTELKRAQRELQRAYNALERRVQGRSAEEQAGARYEDEGSDL